MNIGSLRVKTSWFLIDKLKWLWYAPVMVEVDCPFCEIDQDDVIEIGSSHLVILSDPRAAPGHILVMPRRHILAPWDLTQEERKSVLDTILKYQEKIIQVLAPGCDVKQNYRPYVHQGRVKVDHVHYHLFPRFEADEIDKVVGSAERTLWKGLQDEERQRIKSILWTREGSDL